MLRSGFRQLMQGLLSEAYVEAHVMDAYHIDLNIPRLYLNLILNALNSGSYV